MPRSARILPPEGFFHILTRGNNKQDVFHELKDFRKYKSILWEVKKEHAYRLYHYCLMTNHVHLLLETVAGQPLSVIMKKINLRYAQYYRKKYDYHGHFWQDRYKSLLVGRDNYLLECAAYIELNPLKAGMEREVGRYEHTSYRFHAYGSLDPLLMPNPVYEEFGDGAKARQHGYQKFVAGRIERWEEYQKHIESRNVVGEECFLKALEEKMAITIQRRKRGRPKKEIIKK